MICGWPIVSMPRLAWLRFETTLSCKLNRITLQHENRRAPQRCTSVHCVNTNTLTRSLPARDECILHRLIRPNGLIPHRIVSSHNITPTPNRPQETDPSPKTFGRHGVVIVGAGKDTIPKRRDAKQEEVRQRYNHSAVPSPHLLIMNLSRPMSKKNW